MAFKSYHTMNGQIIGESEETSSTDYILDGLGSVIGTWRSTGTIQNQYRYSGYGQQVHKSGTGADPYFLWVGGWGYRTRGMVYVRRRTYYEKAAVWTSVDPLWPDESAYGYGLRCPATLVDPSGTAILPYLVVLGVVLLIGIAVTCARDCDCGADPCKFGEEHFGAHENKVGWVMCCNGVPHPCVKSEIDDPDVRECTMLHEMFHASMALIDKRCGKCHTLKLNGSMGEREECMAHLIDARCWWRKIVQVCKQPPRKGTPEFDKWRRCARKAVGVNFGSTCDGLLHWKCPNEWKEALCDLA